MSNQIPALTRGINYVCARLDDGSLSNWIPAAAVGSAVGFLRGTDNKIGTPCMFAVCSVVQDLFWKHIQPKMIGRYFMNPHSNWQSRSIGAVLGYVGCVAFSYIGTIICIDLFSRLAEEDKTMYTFKLSDAFVLSIISPILTTKGHH